VIPVRDYLRSPPGSDSAVAFAVARSILEAAHDRAEAAGDLRADPPAFGGKTFLQKLGVAGDAKAVTWTPELIGRGLALYAGFTGEPPERFAEEVRAEVEERAEELGRKVRRLEREEKAVARLLDGSAGVRAEYLLPSGGRDERVAKYERHLHNLLTSTLHELERLQARREGELVPPPAVADVSVTIDAGAA
jgi:hypothetical protein